MVQTMGTRLEDEPIWQNTWNFFNKGIDKKFLTLVLTVLVFWFLILFAVVTPIDTDLGWHLRYGENILQTKTISQVDSFTHTVPGRPHIDHEWLFEVGQFVSYQLASFWGLILVSAVITVLAFWLPTTINPSLPLARLLVLPLAYFISWPVLMFGSRPQLFTVLGLAFFYWALVRFRDKNSWVIYLLPLLMVFWTNIHAGFNAGLALIFLFLVGEGIRIFLVSHGVKFSFLIAKNLLTIKQWLAILGIGIVSFLSSLLNPSGVDIIIGSFKAVTGVAPYQTILEWTPLNYTTFFGIFFLLTLFIIGYLFLVLGNKITLTEVLIFLFFSFMALQARRHLPLLAVTFIPVLLPQLSVLGHAFAKASAGKKIKTPIVLLVMIVSAIILSLQTLERLPRVARQVSSINEYAKIPISGYQKPHKAIQWVKNNKPQGKIFNFYDWGGYLIWQLPEYKVFIDGRLPGTPLFTEYNQAINGQNWQETFQKYDVSFTFLPPNLPINQKLREAGWKQVYFDGQTTIFMK